MAEPDRRRLEFVSFAYAIGGILVVFGHSYPLGKAYIPETLLTIRSFIYTFHMPLFFFISGMLLNYTSECSNHHSYKQELIFIKKKASKLLIPYFLLALVAIIPKYMVSQYISDTVSLDGGYLIKTLLSPRDNVWGHFWFIPVLFFFFCFRIIWLRAAKRTALAIALTVFVVVLHFYPLNSRWVGLRDISIYCIFFWLGVISSEYVITKQLQLFSLFLSIFSLTGAMSIFFGLSYNWVSTSLKGLSLLLIAVLMIYAILGLGIEYQRRNFSFFAVFNEKIFTIFLLSWPFQAVVEVCFNKILKLSWLWVTPAMFTAGLLGPLLVIYMINKMQIKNQLLRTTLGLSSRSLKNEQ